MTNETQGESRLRLLKSARIRMENCRLRVQKLSDAGLKDTPKYRLAVGRYMRSEEAVYRAEERYAGSAD